MAENITSEQYHKQFMAALKRRNSPPLRATTNGTPRLLAFLGSLKQQRGIGVTQPTPVSMQAPKLPEISTKLPELPKNTMPKPQKKPYPFIGKNIGAV